MDNLIERFKKLDTPSITDAMNKLGFAGGLKGVKPVAQGRPICGRAFTVHYIPCGVVKGTVGDFIDDVKPGEVVVIDNCGRDYCTVWGDIMAMTAVKKGIEGTVIDGVCRDIPVVKESGYPIYSKGWYMETGKDRVEVDAINIPVAVSGVKVSPGDIIVGDDTGVACVPKEIAEQVADIAEKIAETESKIVEEVMNGSTLKEARAKLNYHHLQTKITAE